jgi:hypothetical protein
VPPSSANAQHPKTTTEKLTFVWGRPLYPSEAGGPEQFHQYRIRHHTKQAKHITFQTATTMKIGIRRHLSALSQTRAKTITESFRP